MSTAHLHLILNHVPVLGTFFALALIGVAVARRSDDNRRAGLAALVLSALAAIPAFLTGEGAEDAVEALPGVSKRLIESHENAAGVALGVLLVAGALALVALVLERRGKARVLVPFVLAAGLAAAALMSYTAWLGGGIRHTELQASPGRGEKTRRHND